MIKFLDLQKQYASIRQEIESAVSSVLSSCAFVGGPAVESFERQFAGYTGCAHCVGVANGTDALEIALWALALPAGSEVIVPANSFVATSEAVTRAGLSVVFADCDADYTISLDSLQANISPRTAAIIPVHLYGQVAKMSEINEIAKRHGAYVIEDAAQAHGASLQSQKAGTFGSLGCFSFYPGKNLGAYGDGGAIVTNDTELAERCRMYANHGGILKYQHEFEGRNSRLDSLQAAVLSIKLCHLDAWNNKRRNVAAAYLQGIANKGVVLPPVRSGCEHVWHIFAVRCRNRNALREALANEKIQTGIHYPKALPKLPAYARQFDSCRSYAACSWDEELLSLPIGEHLEDWEVQKVIETVNRAVV